MIALDNGVPSFGSTELLAFFKLTEVETVIFVHVFCPLVSLMDHSESSRSKNDKSFN